MKLLILATILSAHFISVLSMKLFFEPLGKLNDQNTDKSNHWAFLVAGSKGWHNYRHQANICHAYQLLRSHGMPADRIVTMMYDDIANHTQNPFKGNIINQPGGPNVYDGVVIDYKGDDVNPYYFLAILRGDKKTMTGIGSGRVIASGPNDHVFVNFVDHGGPAVLGFPYEKLYRRELLETLEKMSAEKKFGQMVIYLEACYSGSMFEGLSSDLNVYSVTSANEHEPAHVCYFDERRGVYLGSIFSVNWMQDTEKQHLSVETLKDQYNIVKEKTLPTKDSKGSHVMQYGNMMITEETLDEFQGEKDFNVPKLPNEISTPEPTDLVPQDLVPLAVLYRRLDKTSDLKEQNEIKNLIREIMQQRDAVDETMTKIVHRTLSMTNHNVDEVMNAKHSVKSDHCYEHVVDTFHEHCFDITEGGHVSKSLWKLVNMCEENIRSEVIAKAIVEVCRS